MLPTRIKATARVNKPARAANRPPREQAILTLVVSGRRNKQIAFEIGTSEVTVEVHRIKLMRNASIVAGKSDYDATKLGIPEKPSAPLSGSGDL
jgi:FixJ family two-component response regulator